MIQWFPGHMHKASKEFKKILPQVDLVIEVLDARLPGSSTNPMLARLRRDKPCVKLLNKSDLSDPARLALWEESLGREAQVRTLVCVVPTRIIRTFMASAQPFYSTSLWYSSALAPSLGPLL